LCSRAFHPTPSNPNSGSWAPGLSKLEYDANGHIMRLTDTSYAGGPRVVNYTNDAYGQVLVREEKVGGVIGPRQLYYYFNGQRIGDVGNNAPSTDPNDYMTQYEQ
jgi:large repetitive protein